MMSDSKSEPVGPRRWNMLFWLLLAIYSALLLWDPAADPPLGPSDLEGQMLQGAVVFSGKANPLGEWNPSLVAPVQSLVTGSAFRAFGRELGVARTVAAVAALLAVVLFYGLVRRSRGSATALLAALLLMTNPVFFAVARTSLPAVFSLLWMLVTIRLWLLGARYRWAAFLSGVALLGAGLIENGPDAVFFLGAGFFMAFVLRLHAWRMPWLGAVRGRLGAVFTGVALAGILLFTLISTHWGGYGILWGHFHSTEWRMVASNVVLAPVYASRLVEHMLVPAGIVLVYFLFFAKDVIWPVARHRQLDETRLWFLGWLLAGGVFLLVTPAASLQRLALMTPPLCAVAAEGLIRLVGQRRLSRPRVDVMIVMLLIVGATWFAVAWGVHIYYARLAPEGFFQEHHIRGAFLLVAVLWLGLTSLFGWLYLKWTRLSINLRPGFVIVLFALLIEGALLPGAATIGFWRLHPRHEVALAGERVRAKLPPSALVVGSWAPLLTLEGPQRAAVVSEGINDRDPAWAKDVTHLLLRDGPESDPTEPPRAVLPTARLIPGEFAIWGTTVRVYLVDDHLEP